MKSTSDIAIVRSVEDLRAQVSGWKAAGKKVALVPTMGALHAGHVSLVHLARAHAEKVVVSIFVNPTQFAPNEDLARYPRTFEADCAALSGIADLVFAPEPETMYPDGACTFVELEGPARAGLEDRFRPTHFRGVATVVTKLMIQAMPDFAVFGEKDYQQLKVVTRMARDLFIPVRILPGPTMRESDGLALSSRNRYLDPDQRALAPLLHKALSDCAARIREGAPIDWAVGDARAQLKASGFALDYLEARDADDLGTPSAGRPLRLLVAATLGHTRLIDNLAV